MPADLIIPPRLERSEASFARTAELIAKPRRPTKALREMMSGKRSRGQN